MTRLLRTVAFLAAIAVALALAFTVQNRGKDSDLKGDSTAVSIQADPEEQRGGTGASTAPLETDSGTGSSRDTKFVLPERLQAATSNSNSFFSDVPEDELQHDLMEPFLEKRAIDAYRIVIADSDSLRSVIRDSAQEPTFDIKLLDGPPLRLVSQEAAEHSSGWQTGIGSWLGSIAGEEESRASLVIGPDGTVNGVVRSLSTGRIKIEAIEGTPHHIIWRRDRNAVRKID